MYPDIQIMNKMQMLKQSTFKFETTKKIRYFLITVLWIDRKKW